MNGRIEELMVKAGAKFEFLHGVRYDDFQYREFSRLIIQECMTIADLPNSADGKYDAFLPSEMIAKHFGANDAMES